MSLKSKIAYWVTGEWVLDLFFGWTKQQNKKITGKDDGAEPKIRTVICKSSNFCEDMRNGSDGKIYCNKERFGCPVSCEFAINPEK